MEKRKSVLFVLPHVLGYFIFRNKKTGYTVRIARFLRKIAKIFGDLEMYFLFYPYQLREKFHKKTKLINDNPLIITYLC